MVECGRLHPENLVGPEQVGLLPLGYLDEVAVEAIDVRPHDESVDDPVHHCAGGGVGQVVERDYLMAKTFECPETIQRGVVRGEVRRVENLHSSLIIR